jgi:hypothetical protein
MYFSDDIHSFSVYLERISALILRVHPAVLKRSLVGMSFMLRMLTVVDSITRPLNEYTGLRVHNHPLQGCIEKKIMPLDFKNRIKLIDFTGLLIVCFI